MVIQSGQGPWSDPDRLAPAAAALLKETPSSGGHEEALRRARAEVSGILRRIDQCKQASVPVDYPALFSERADDRLAALLFLAQHVLCDLEQEGASTREIAETRRELPLILEILFRLKATDGFILLYDFAAEQPENTERPYWSKVCLRCLHLLALLPDGRATVLAFLKTHPRARREIEQLMASPDPSLAKASRDLGEDYLRARQSGALEAPPPAPAAYCARYALYAAVPFDRREDGMSSHLAAEERIRQAVQAGDLPALLAWFREGSPLSAQVALRCARALPARRYLDFLTEVVEQRPSAPVLLAAVTLEIGRLNRANQPEGGEEKTNALLYTLSMVDDAALSGVARLAVRELGAVRALNELLSLLEHAPLLAVAEDALWTLFDQRRMPLAEKAAATRADLRSALEEASRKQQRIDGTLDALWACQDDEMTDYYLQQLVDLRAIPELTKVSTGKTRISEAARRALSELRSRGDEVVSSVE